jgi:hypothetical protein
MLQKRIARVGYLWETGGKNWLARSAGNGYNGVKRLRGRGGGFEIEAWGEPLGGRMRKAYLLVAAVVLEGISAEAKTPQAGTIISESSVACGSQVAKNKKSTADVLCQEYVVRTETTEYHIRQEKAANKELIPVNTNITFELNKDKMKFEANGKKYEYIVVSEAAVTAAKP